MNKLLAEKEKLGDVESFEELKVLAKETGINISDEELKKYFDEETMSLKLGEDDLEKVAGGDMQEGKEQNPELY